MSDINKKYPVNTAVWIATALLAAETFEKKSSCSKLDMYFDQPIIVLFAQRIADDNVEEAKAYKNVVPITKDQIIIIFAEILRVILH